MRESYFDDRNPKGRRFIFRLKVYGVIALFFLLVVGIAYAVIYSPIFKIQKITIHLENSGLTLGGTAGLDGKKDSDANILVSVKDFILTHSVIARYLGIDNVLSWDNGLFINFEFPHKCPQIAGLVVKRDFLKREISIEAKKREKLGIWCFVKQIIVNGNPSIAGSQQPVSQSQAVNRSDKKNCYWFDRDGIIFADAPEVEGDLIYRIDDYTGRQLALGDGVLISGFFANLLKIFGVMDNSDLRSRSFSLKNLDLEEIDTNPAVSSSPVVYLSLRNSPEFAAEFLKSLKKLGLDKSQYLDLRVENRVYYK